MRLRLGPCDRLCRRFVNRTGRWSRLAYLGYASRSLTSLGPQPPHKPAERYRFPWSEGFDRIFRNEGVGGSNPPSSTKPPGQRCFCPAPDEPIRTLVESRAPQRPHKIGTVTPSFSARCFLTSPHGSSPLQVRSVDSRRWDATDLSGSGMADPSPQSWRIMPVMGGSVRVSEVGDVCHREGLGSSCGDHGADDMRVGPDARAFSVVTTRFSLRSASMLSSVRPADQ